MLKSIRIRNFAIVEEISIDFSDGFNLITGETGAGKSLIVDALEILLGERSSASFIRTGEKKAVVEGIFSVGQARELDRMLEKAGIPASDEIILKREISSAGGGKIFINDETASSTTLKSFGSLLVDIHGQHQHQSLLNPQNHLAFLDSFGENDKLLAEVADAARQLTNVVNDLERLKQEMIDREKKIDFLDFQLAEIERVSPSPGEDENLSKEIEILKNAEMLRSLAVESYSDIYEEERSVLSLLKRISQNLEKLSGIDREAAPFLTTLDEARFSIEDLSLYLRDYVKKLDFDPGRLSQASDRAAEIERLKRKHGGAIEAVLEFRTRARDDLDRLKESEQNLEHMKKQVEEYYAQYRSAAGMLSKKRSEDGRRFSRKVIDELGDIAMEKCRFAVDRAVLPLPDAFDPSQGPSWSQNGIDRVEFLISMNVGEDLRPLSRIASGGELSRIMLAINAVMKKEDRIKTLIFDEVDAGIGAGIASNVGAKLKGLSKKNQVICITHLPQIASLADHHLKVVKTVAGERTVVNVEAIEGKDRVREIARMLAGEKLSPTSLRHAEEMIRNEKRETPRAKSGLSRDV